LGISLRPVLVPASVLAHSRLVDDRPLGRNPSPSPPALLARRRVDGVDPAVETRGVEDAVRDGDWPLERADA